MERTRKDMPQVRALIALPCLCALLNGCISSYTPHTDEPPAETADSSAHCPYDFAYDNVAAWFRGDAFYRYDWGPAEDFGYRNVKPALHNLAGACPDAPDETRIEARIEAYFLEYSSAAGGLASVLVNLAIFPYTFGFLPTPSTDHYAVCLQVTADDGLVRKGLVTGKLSSFTNIWGSGNTRSNQGESDRVNTKEQLMRELSIQAWQEAWTLPQEVARATTCLEDMDAIRKR